MAHDEEGVHEFFVWTEHNLDRIDNKEADHNRGNLAFERAVADRIGITLSIECFDGIKLCLEL